MKISRVKGEDSEDAWNDAHLKHVFLWLIKNDRSPFFGAPTMLMGAMKIDPVYRKNLISSLRRGNLGNYRFATRISLTAGFKRVLSGLYEPKVLSRTSAGVVLKFEIRPSASPQPLPCPPFYRGSIQLTRDGMKVRLRQSDAVLTPMHNPEGMDRLKNPFGGR